MILPKPKIPLSISVRSLYQCWIDFVSINVEDLAQPESDQIKTNAPFALFVSLLFLPFPAACLQTITLLGPMFGFLLGSYCARLYVDIGYVDMGRRIHFGQKCNFFFNLQSVALLDLSDSFNWFVLTFVTSQEVQLLHEHAAYIIWT